MRSLLALLMAVIWSLFSNGAMAGTLLEKKLVHDGLERSYFLYVPTTLQKSVKPPLLIALHGGGRPDGDDYAERTGYPALADRYGFVVAFPNGVSSQWNDGRGKTFRRADDNTDVDDVGFLSALIDVLVAAHDIHPKKIYVEGSSNGGMMAQRLACELSDKISAVASVISSMPYNIVDTCQPDRPISMLVMNGDADPIVPYEGGAVTVAGMEYGEVLSTKQTVDFWRVKNKCIERAQQVIFPDHNKLDSSRVSYVQYSGCAEGADVVLYVAHGGGHSRPGSENVVPNRLIGTVNQDIHASEVIWDFFRKHSR